MFVQKREREITKYGGYRDGYNISSCVIMILIVPYRNQATSKSYTSGVENDQRNYYWQLYDYKLDF